MSNVEIKVYPIGRTTVDHAAISDWLEDMGVKTVPSFLDEDNNELDQLVACAAKRCYKSFEPGLNKNVTKVREDLTAFLDNILASGHGSVLEHGTYSFAIEGVSRVFTGEMNRHRAGWAISEGSMRFIRFDEDIPWWMPTSITTQGDENVELAGRKQMSRRIFEEVFTFVQERYAELLKIWDMDETDKNFDYKKKVTSCLRRIIPMGVATGGVWTGNIRALRHVIAMRTSSAAEEEIALVFSEIAAWLSRMHPNLFGDFVETPEGYWVPKYPKV